MTETRASHHHGAGLHRLLDRVCVCEAIGNSRLVHVESAILHNTLRMPLIALGRESHCADLINLSARR
jgi:hypothetical protein